MTIETVRRLMPLHSAQQEVAEHPAKVKVVRAGRRWGKSCLALHLCLAEAAAGGQAWLVCPNYALTNHHSLRIRSFVAHVDAAKLIASNRKLSWGDGSIQLGAAYNPDSLPGGNPDLLALDELAFMSEKAWTEFLLPILLRGSAKVLSIGTPKLVDSLEQKSNLFEEMYHLARWLPDWQTWCFPTETNPYIDPGMIEHARQALSEAAFRGEFMAEFVTAKEKDNEQ